MLMAKKTFSANWFVRILIGKSDNASKESSSRDLGGAGNSDMFTWAIELSFTPVLTFGIGFLIDNYFHTLPWFAISGLLFGVFGSIVRMYYGLTKPESGEIGRGLQRSASIIRRSKNLSMVEPLGSHTLMDVDFSLSEEILRSAAIVDGVASHPQEQSVSTSQE